MLREITKSPVEVQMVRLQPLASPVRRTIMIMRSSVLGTPLVKTFRCSRHESRTTVDESPQLAHSPSCPSTSGAARASPHECHPPCQDLAAEFETQIVNPARESGGFPIDYTRALENVSQESEPPRSFLWSLFLSRGPSLPRAFTRHQRYY